jgi:molybdopterin-guanine dinucleotide biosynthesis adapter protein
MASRQAPLFDLVVMVDWSAAAGPGPARPSPDRCWIAWGTQEERPPPAYFRTRHAAVAWLARLLEASPCAVLVGWDFPHGFPAGAGLGGGRKAAARLARLVSDAPDGANNRFLVAARLNRRLGRPPGPFWGCPAWLADADLRDRRGGFAERGFGEWRTADGLLRRQGYPIQSVWKLYTRGSVGSQTLLGLPAIHALLTRPALARRSRWWPFDTGWDRSLAGIVHAEVWPSLADHEAAPYPIKDARQVAAARDWALALDAAGRLRPCFARPPGLTEETAAACLGEEGWILNALPALAGAGPVRRRRAPT